MPELLERTTSAELTEWMAYERVTGPLGPERLDLQMAMLTAVVRNTTIAKGRRARAEDFLIPWDQGAARSGGDPEQMLATARALTLAMGGTDLTGGGGGGQPSGDSARRDWPGRQRADRRRRGRGR